MHKLQIGHEECTNPAGKDVLYVKHVTLSGVIRLVQLFMESATEQQRQFTDVGDANNAELAFKPKKGDG